MADAGCKIRDEPWAARHPNRRHARPIETDVNRLHSRPRDSRSTYAERADSNPSFRGGFLENVCLAQKRVPPQPDIVVVNDVEDLFAGGAYVHATLNRSSTFHN